MAEHDRSAALMAAFEVFQTTPNPPWPFENEELADLIADLFLDHASLHGLASSGLRGERVDASGIDLAPFRLRLESIAVSELDRPSYDATDQYLTSMEAIVEALAE